jgi:hypothetical protein
MGKQQPWGTGDATETIRQIARSSGFRITYTGHAKEQMQERDLIVSDVIYILKNGFVYDEAQTSTQLGLFKYVIESRSPNSGNRSVRIVTIPDPQNCWIKIVTVMWADKT